MSMKRVAWGRFAGVATGRWRVLWLPLAAGLAWPLGGVAGDDVGEEELATAVVEIDGQALFRVRGASSLPAEKRAAAIAERIKTAAADPLFRPDQVRVDDDGRNAFLYAGDQPLMRIGDADGRLERFNRQELATVHQARIRQAVEEYRQLRSRAFLLRSTGVVVAATGLLLLALALLYWLGQWLDRFLGRLAARRARAIGIQEFELVRAKQITSALHGALSVLRVLAALAVLAGYFDFALSRFPWTRPLANRFFALLAAPLGMLGRALVANIPDLLALVVLGLLFRLILRVCRLFFDAVEAKRVRLAGFDEQWAYPTYKLVRFLLVAFALVVAYPYIPGSSSEAFKGVSIFIGVLFSIGSSSAISNLVAGYMITYRRAFKVGDWVQIGETCGMVTALRLQVTHLRTRKNEEVTIPNSQIVGGTVTNYSVLARSHGLILHTTLGIGYATPWRQVEALLLQAAARTPGVQALPAPFVLVKEFGAFAVTYELNAYAREVERLPFLYTELNQRILDAFNEHGVQIMVPAYESDVPAPQVVPPEQWYAAPAVPPANAAAAEKKS